MKLILFLLASTVYAQTTTATVGVPFSQAIAAPVSNGGYLVTINGIQEISADGLSYDNTTGILSGTPTAAGTYNIEVQQATPTAGVYTTTKLTLTVNAAGTTPPVTPVTPVTPALFCATDPNPACGVSLVWQAPTTSTPAVTGYLVFRSVAGGSAIQLTPTAIQTTTYTDKTIDASTTYDYYVVSVDAAGTQSAPSNTFSVVVATAPSIPTPPTPQNLTGSVIN
jgi:hypothetical protein